MNKSLLEKYAELTIKVGVNLQKNQLLVINASVEVAPLVRLIVKEAYKVGASDVLVRWNDQIVGKEWYLHASDEVLESVENWIIEQFKYVVEKNAAVISISSPNPGLLKDVPGARLQKANLVHSKALDFYQKHMMASKSQWVVIAAPNADWAKRVFPDHLEEEAINDLWNAIFKASRVQNDNDPVREWEKHMDALAKHNDILNQHQFKALHFKNKLGTDLIVNLVENHIWAGGREMTTNGVEFAPNIPTEETFTMPHRLGVNGKVVSTKPLNYQGKLIEDFYLVFKDGKVIEYDAKAEKDALKNLLELDEGSSYLGEVALISNSSPISDMNILFFNTLFDENASCHLALGSCYPMNVKDGVLLSEEELKEKGGNKSLTHVDFMFGSNDMSVIGIKQTGEEVIIFQNGNFVF